jgi:hypothetical protein
MPLTPEQLDVIRKDTLRLLELEEATAAKAVTTAGKAVTTAGVS